jgi:hypothetical protein
MRHLLTTRRDQLGGDFSGTARFVIVQPHDRPRWLEDTLGFSLFQNVGDATWFGDPEFTPGWEWIKDHGFAWELVFIFDDSGFAHVVIFENQQGMSAKLRDLCSTYSSEHT